jgi:hypothetical protein
MNDPLRICLVSASRENVFFAEILEAFGAALAEQGLRIERSVDCFPTPAANLVCMFVAHEFGAFVEELAHPTPEQLRRSVAVCTEQPGTDWFKFSINFAAPAGAVVDLNPLGVAELRRLGIAADHARLGYVAGWDAWRGREDDRRSIDLAFLGRHTDERAQVIARCRPALERRRAAIHLTETFLPHRDGSACFLTGRRRSELLANSKVLLNVHQQELPYLEWHRVLNAVLNGCVVLSESATEASPFESGTHYFSTRRQDLPHALEALLEDPERLARTRDAAYQLVRDEMPMSATAEVLLAAVERADREPLPQRSSSPPPPVPMPTPPETRKPAWQIHAEQRKDDLALRSGLKDLLIRVRNLERQVEQVAAPDQIDPEVEVEELGPASSRPEVSVVLTAYNHADLVGDAIRSVALADMSDVEVVAVDDGSSDGTADAIAAAAAESPWLSVRLVRRPDNSGLPAIARNLAVTHARAEKLFVLDGDNLVLPQGLTKLAAALDDDPGAAFANGIVERFDQDGPRGLFSYLDWDPERFRYGNYIDAMAMIRASALEAVGGYPTEQVLGGWEDFALWLAMADAGMRGVRVPDFVGRYRVSPYSMLTTADLDQASIWTTLLRRYPVLTRSDGVPAGDPGIEAVR